MILSEKWVIVIIDSDRYWFENQSFGHRRGIQKKKRTKKKKKKKWGNDIIGERDHNNNSYGWILSWESIAHGQKEAPKNHLYLLGFFRIFVLI